jgi:hypothetical protein
MSSLRRFESPFAAAVFFVGLLVFLGSLLAIGVLSVETGPQAIDPRGPYSGNGTATYLMMLPYGRYDLTGHVTGSWSFPQGTGRFLVVSCSEVANLTRGEPIPDPVLATAPSGHGSIDLPTRDLLFIDVRDARDYCGPNVMALQWAAGADPTLTAPRLQLQAENDPLAGATGVVLLAISGLGVILVAVGGTVWLRGQREPPAAGPAPEESTAESLRQLTDRSVAWLERMRRYLRLGGVLGLLLWYPVVLAWAWSIAHVSTTSSVPLLLALVVVAFLGVLTTLWAREYHAISRELRGWRERVEALRRREEEMMERFASH